MLNKTRVSKISIKIIKTLCLFTVYLKAYIMKKKYQG